MIVPAGYAIRDIFVLNTTVNPVTGGIRIGTTSGGTQVIVALAVGGGAFILSTEALLRAFSSTIDQILYIQAVTSWNGASLDIVVTLDLAIP